MSLVFERRVVSRKLSFAESLLALAGSYLLLRSASMFKDYSPKPLDIKVIKYNEYKLLDNSGTLHEEQLDDINMPILRGPMQ